MPKTTPAEWLLSRITDPTRAAAIIGDLCELAQTRGTLWFWTAYARTLVSLGWRTPVAFACGFGAFQLLATLRDFWLAHAPGAWHDCLLPTLVSLGPALGAATVTLWLIVPYVAIRYGLRDRLVQLASVLLLLDTTTFLYIPWLSIACATMAAILLLAALWSKTWHAAAAVLVPVLTVGAATFACAIGAIALGTRYLSEQFHPGQLIYRQPIPGIVWNAGVLAAMLVIAGGCSRMRRWLMPTTLIAGGTNG